MTKIQSQTAKALQTIRRSKPVTLQAFTDLGLLGRYVGSGVFRCAYRVRGTSLVVKLPLNEGTKKKPYYQSGIDHSLAEVRRILKLAKIKELRPHLPAVHYYDRRNGILVLTWYERIACHWERVELLGDVISELICRVAHTRTSDISPENIRLLEGKPNRLIFCDLGY